MLMNGAIVLSARPLAAHYCARSLPRTIMSSRSWPVGSAFATPEADSGRLDIMFYALYLFQLPSSPFLYKVISLQ